MVQACTISASDLAFGSINVVQNIEFDANTTLQVTCGEGVTYNIGLDQGTGAGGTTTTRVMTGSGGGSLNYALYQDNAHTQNWGNSNLVDTYAGTGNGTTQTVAVFGVIPAGQQSAPFGTYTDSIAVNVYY